MGVLWYLFRPVYLTVYCVCAVIFSPLDVLSDRPATDQVHLAGCAPGCRAVQRLAKRSGGLLDPTAVPEVDRGLPDAQKVVLDLRIGV